MRSYLMLALVTFGIFLNNAMADTSYYRQILINTANGQKPLELTIRLGNPHPWPNPQGFLEAPITDRYWVDNEGGLIFLNNSMTKITRYDLAKNSSQEFSLPIEKSERTLSIYFDSMGKLYIEIENKNDKLSTTFKLSRYKLVENKYILDDTFRSDTFNKPTGCFPISPDDHIFLYNAGQTVNGKMANVILDSTGRDLGATQAIGRTSNGLEFYIDSKTVDNKTRLKIMDALSDAAHYEKDFERHIYNNFVLATSDGEVIFTVSNNIREDLPEDRYVINAQPSIYIWNSADGAVEQIETNELTRPEFRYFNISEITANYKGDIFATAIYYNYPGEIHGDELIVIYRWVKK